MMSPTVAGAKESLVGVLSAWLIRSAVRRAVDASDALSEALFEASSGALNSNKSIAVIRDDLAKVPLRALDLYLDRRSGPAAPRRTTAIPVACVVAAADAYLARVPGRAALLQNLVAHVAHITGYEVKRVRTVIRQNFQSNATLVWQ